MTVEEQKRVFKYERTQDDGDDDDDDEEEEEEMIDPLETVRESCNAVGSNKKYVYCRSAHRVERSAWSTAREA